MANDPCCGLTAQLSNKNACDKYRDDEIKSMTDSVITLSSVDLVTWGKTT